MSATPGVYKTQFNSLFKYKKESLVPLSFIEKELYLEGQYKTHSELERYLRHSNIISNHSFIEKNGILYLKDYEYVGSNKIPNFNTNLVSTISSQKNKEEYNINRENLEERRKHKKKSKPTYDSDDYDRKSTKSYLSFVSQSDLDLIRRDINGMQSEFQNHGDKMYTVAKKQEDYLRRLEGVCNSQDHQEWLESIDFNDIPIKTKRILLKKLLHSDLNDTLKIMSDIMSEEDGRKHNILLTIDGIKSGTEIELENRTIWSNSNRGDYRFQMHDQVSFLSSLFGGEQKVIESKTKYDHHIVNHLKK